MQVGSGLEEMGNKVFQTERLAWRWSRPGMSNRNIMRIIKASHVCHLKFVSSHIKKVKVNRSDSVLYYLSNYIIYYVLYIIFYNYVIYQ